MFVAYPANERQFGAKSPNGGLAAGHFVDWLYDPLNLGGLAVGVRIPIAPPLVQLHRVSPSSPAVGVGIWLAD